MNHVGGVKELGDGRVDILVRLVLGIRLVRQLGRVGEVECFRISSIWAGVLDV